MSPVRNLFSRSTAADIWLLLEPVRPTLWLTTSLLIITQLLQLATPYLFKLVLDTATHLTAGSMPRLLTLVGYSFAATLIVASIRLWRDHRIFDLLLTLERELPIQAQQKLLALSLGFHEKQRTGKTLVRVERGVSRFVDLMANSLFDAIPTSIQIIGTFLFLAVLDWRVALVFFPINPLFVWLTRRINRRVAPLRKEIYDLGEQAGSQMAQSLMNVNTVQSFGQQEREVAGHTITRDRILQTESREWQIVLNANFWRDQAINLGRNMVLLFSVWLLLRHEITVGSLVLFVTLSETAYMSLFRMSRLFDRGAEWAEALGRLANLIREPLRVTDSCEAVAIGTMEGRLSFQNVSFGYPGSGRPALRDMSFAMAPGSTTAFVGPSGGGKSTIVRLIFRHYDPDMGDVKIDGQSLRNLTMQSYRQQMAIVPQEVEVFDLTVRENIAYAKPEASFEEIVAAAKKANAHDFIMALPNGYDTHVGERGIRLSGGQRQRLGIARALLPNPRIVVFDEATSSLDSESERLIQEALLRIRGQRTLIIIAHRLSTVRAADTIHVVQHGQIIESGSHEKLITVPGGVYAHLFHLQTEAQQMAS